MLHRSLLRGLVDHWCARAAVAPSGARGRRVPADRAAGAAAALNDRPRSGRPLADGALPGGSVSGGPGRAVTRDSAGDPTSSTGATATPERGAVLADDAAVRCAAGRDAPVGCAARQSAACARGTGGMTAQLRTANADARGTGSVTAESGAAGNRWGRRGSGCVAAEAALAAQRGRPA